MDVVSKHLGCAGIAGRISLGFSVGYDVVYALHRMVAREAIRGPDRAVDRLVRWWVVRNRHKAIRVAVIILSSPVAVLAGLFLALQLLALGCLSYSSPVYSPDRSQAVRIRTDDEGATGGNSHVELFWNHGFSSKEVYSGGWKSVDVKDLKWESNSMLDLRHDSPMYVCESSRSVKVNCLERSSQAGTGRA